MRRRRAQQESGLDESDLRDARRKDQDKNKIKHIKILYCMSGGGLFMALRGGGAR